MDHEKVARGIQAEFGVPCLSLGDVAIGTHKLWPNYEGYYRWDAPAGIEGKHLHELRLRIETRLGQLQAEADREEGCPFSLYDPVIRRSACDSSHWGYIHRFDGPNHVLVCWLEQGMTRQFREAIADLVSYDEWKKNPLAGIQRYWLLDEHNRKRLREAIEDNSASVAPREK